MTKYEQSDLVYLKDDKSKIFYIVKATPGSPNTYVIGDIDDVLTRLKDVKESELEDCNEKVEFTVTIKGSFPQKFVDSMLNKKYADVKMGVGKVTITGTKKDFDKWYEETIEAMNPFHDFKVIGINYNTIKKPAFEKK